MNYNKLEYFISQPRLNRFLTASGTSKTKAQAGDKLPISSSFNLIFQTKQPE